MAQIAQSEPAFQALDQMKQAIWNNSNLSERQREELWSQQQAKLLSLIDSSCRTNNAERPAHVPRTVSYDVSLLERQASVC